MKNIWWTITRKVTNVYDPTNQVIGFVQYEDCLQSEYPWVACKPNGERLEKCMTESGAVHYLMFRYWEGTMD